VMSETLEQHEAAQREAVTPHPPEEWDAYQAKSPGVGHDGTGHRGVEERLQQRGQQEKRVDPWP
jgi:hypothetical protein